jgi:RNA polymerase sigma-70 factor (ECF subfamily)
MPLAMEQEVVSAARKGNQDAFAALYEYHRVRVMARAQQIVKNSADAEDITNLTFAQAFSKLHQFKGDSRFSTWIYRIATNAALMSLRTSKYKPEFVSLEEMRETRTKQRFGEDTLTDSKYEETHDERLEKVPERIDLERAIEQLPKGYKQAMVLHGVLDYEHHEIADITGKTVGCSKSQFAKARQKMRQML